MGTISSLTQLDLENGRYTYADYLTWKFDQAVELIKGKILPMAAPSRRHQEVSWQLSLKIGNHFAKHPCAAYAAPFDVRLHDRRKSTALNQEVFTVVQPDLCVVCDLNKLDDNGCLGAPDLMVEILSPGNSFKEMKLKRALYEESGVREYWIVDPEHENVFQFHLTEAGIFSPATIYADKDELQSVIFPDFKVKLKVIFQSKKGK